MCVCDGLWPECVLNKGRWLEKTECDIVKIQYGGRETGRRRDISEWVTQIFRENEISFAAGTLNDDNLGVCPFL